MEKPCNSKSCVNTNIGQPQVDCQPNRIEMENDDGHSSESEDTHHQSQDIAAHYSPNINQNYSSIDPSNPRKVIDQTRLGSDSHFKSLNTIHANCGQPLQSIENQLNVLCSSVVDTQQITEANITANDGFESKLTNAGVDTQNNDQSFQLAMLSDTIIVEHVIEMGKELGQNDLFVSYSDIIDLTSDDEKC